MIEEPANGTHTGFRGTYAETEDATSAYNYQAQISLCLRGTCAETEDATGVIGEGIISSLWFQRHLR